MNIEIEKKPKSNVQKAIKLICPKTIYELKEVQEIKDAIQEHLLFIGLDHSNTVRNIRIIGIGSNSYICVDSKDIVRNALINANSKVVLVHNHPSNTLKPSNQDLLITNTTKQLLKDFNKKSFGERFAINTKLYKDFYSEYMVNKIQGKSFETYETLNKIIKEV